MGGIVALTVRFDKDREYRGSCWTNVLPEGLFAAPFYYADASAVHVESWLAAVTEARRDDPSLEEMWGGWDKLAPVEYGIVVVDYLTSTFLCLNGYCGATPIYESYYPEKWRELAAAGLLSNERPVLGTRRADVKLPFATVRAGLESAITREEQAWCEEHFGLSDDERQAWDEWFTRFEE